MKEFKEFISAMSEALGVSTRELNASFDAYVEDTINEIAAEK